MNDFAFMIHPLDLSDITHKYPLLKKVPQGILERGFHHLPAFRLGSIKNITSAETGEAVEGTFVACPLTTQQMLGLPEAYVLRRIVGAGKVAQRARARLLGLGAMTSVVGDAGISVAGRLSIPVTTGNSYTVATAMEGVKKAARIMGTDISEAEVVVVGATGSIGAVCAQLIAGECRHLTLVARDRLKLENLARKIMHDTGQAVRVTKNLRETLQSAPVVITVTASSEEIIEPGYLAPGAVVCDVARPRDVSRRVREMRKDVLVIEGGLVKIPGDVETNVDLGYPPNVTLACIAETMILALERRFECFTLGRDISAEQVREIHRLGRKHGFELAGFRSFEKPLTDLEIEEIKQNARRAKSSWGNVEVRSGPV